MKKSTIMLGVLAIALSANAQQPAAKNANELPPRAEQTATRELPEGFEIITTPPAGEEILYQNSSDGYRYSSGLKKAQGLTPMHVVWCENGDVYLSNIISQYGSDGYIKGHVEGDKVVVNFPQAYYDNMYYGTFFVNLMYADDEDQVYKIVSENNFVTYTIGEDKSLTLDLDNSTDYIVGMTYDNNPDSAASWAYYGDWSQKITRFTDTTVELPENVEPERWEMICEGNARYINVAFDGKNVYFGDFYDSLPNAYIKGLYDEETSTVTFTMPQYLGIDPTWDCFDYFVIGMPTYNAGTLTGYNLQKYIVFEYDKEKRELKERDGRVMFVNDGYGRVYYIEAYNSPLLRYPNPELELAAPMDPVFKMYVPYRESQKCGYTVWDLPNINTNGALINPARMSYIFYVDGEPWTFYTDEYKGFPNDMTEVPWEFNDFVIYDLYHEGATHYIYFYFRDAESVGMESIYLGSDGNTYRSPIVTYDVATGDIIGGVDEVLNSEVIGIEYYDLAGRKVANPEKGLFIRCARLSNGGILTSKVMITE